MEVVELFDKYANRYDSWYDRHEDWFRKEIELIRKFVGDFELGLEVGVGTGRFALELGIKYGVDLSDRMLKLAKSRRVEVVKADARALPFRDDVFDLVLFAFTLCFLEDPTSALREAKRVLRENGKLVICGVPADSKLGREYMKRKDSPFYSNAKLYKVEEIVKMIEEVGMKVKGIDFADIKYGKDVVCISATFN